jgi:predicted acylesterase/phospholipase RssA
MPDHDFSRRRFLGAASLLGLAPALASPAAAADQPNRVDHALCLSGGGARGAYEAGIIDYLRLSKGIADGEPLRPYGIVSGTSIGALNGYFVATAQYSLLRELWYGIADQQVVSLKARYAKVVQPTSGVGTRLTAAMRMALSLASHDTGVVDGNRLRAWMAQYIDPNRAPVMPFVWPVTNLTTQSPEFFYIIGTQLDPDVRKRAQAAVATTVGPNAILREATPDILIDALRASTAIPVAFDPVPLPSADGSRVNLYVDGGVTANTPVSVARAAARNVDVIMLDPPFRTEEYRSAFDIGLGVFGAMQRRILEADLRSAYLENFGKGAMTDVAHASAAATQFAQSLYAANLFVIHPETDLAVSVVGFDDGDNIYKTFETGFYDAQKRGFTAYTFKE